MGRIAKFWKKQVVFLAAAIVTMASMPSVFAMSGTPSGYADAIEISTDESAKALSNDDARAQFTGRQTDPLLYTVNSEAAAIIADIKNRAGAFKISEVDDSIILDAEALIICPKAY